MKKKTPQGYIIKPHGIIEQESLTIEQSVFWGADDKKLGRPAWLRPSRIFRSAKDPFVLLSMNSLAPIPIPGDTPVNTDRERLSKIVEEQYEKMMAVLAPIDGASMQLWFMIAMMVLVMGLAGLGVALGVGTIISEKFMGGNEPVSMILPIKEVMS